MKEMEWERVLDEGRRYLKMSLPEEDVELWTEDRCIRAINRLYFGGLQAFARYVEKKEEALPPSSKQ